MPNANIVGSHDYANKIKDGARTEQNEAKNERKTLNVNQQQSSAGHRLNICL
jgi:hypothetical protein